MNRQIKKILTLLILIVTLPALFFTIYELNSLNDNEKILGDIYESQLDMILFSVNSNSEDIVSRWGNKLASYKWDMEKDREKADSNIDALLKLNRCIKYIYFTSPADYRKVSFYSIDSVYNNSKTRNGITSFLAGNKAKTEKLQSLMEKGYNKFEPIIDTENKGITQILFLSPYSTEPELCGMAIDSWRFVDENLQNKIKTAAHNAFIISVFNVEKVEIVYSNDLSDTGNYSRHKQLWLIPNFEIGIKLRGPSIQKIANKRITTDLLMLLVLTILLVAGAFIIIYNIKKEMRLAEIKSEFVSNVSHELRTPLALINMFAETLSMGRVKTEEKKQEYYQIISREAGRLSNIVNRILNFSQIEAGKRKYNFEIHDVNQIAEKICENYSYHLKNKGFTLNCNIGEEELYTDCDHEALTEAIINLIDNAVKYSSDKKEVGISTRLEKDEILIAVEDKGIGISAEDQKRIFEKFFRVSSGLVHNTKGTGLGLTIVKHIVDAHNGKIELYSKPGEGSKFTIRLKKSSENI